MVLHLLANRLPEKDKTWFNLDGTDSLSDDGILRHGRDLRCDSAALPHRNQDSDVLKSHRTKHFRRARPGQMIARARDWEIRQKCHLHRHRDSSWVARLYARAPHGARANAGLLVQATPETPHGGRRARVDNELSYLNSRSIRDVETAVP